VFDLEIFAESFDDGVPVLNNPEPLFFPSFTLFEAARCPHQLFEDLGIVCRVEAD
jgi:hypothetical protein